MNARQIVPGPMDPVGCIEHFLEGWFDHEEYRTLIFHRSLYWRWSSLCWEVVSPEMLESMVSYYFRHCDYLKSVGTGTNQTWQQTEFPVNNNTLGNLMRALRNKVIVPEDVELNTWLAREGGDAEPGDLIPVQNGVLHVVTRELSEPTPRFFNTYVLSFEYDPYAIPREIYAFMDSVFGDDQQRRELFQEMVGYLATPSRKHQKMFWLIGPPRCGKGTIGRLLKQLVGGQNFTGTSMATLAGEHGLEGIATKPVVQMGDVVSAGGKGAGIALERLLSIIGEDEVEVNPKGKPIYSATLPCRFVLLANKTPILPDTAQALRARTVMLRFYESFLGSEDEELGHRLSLELPGILNWALDGLDRLRSRGKFVQPEAGLEDLALTTRLTAPAAGFIEDLCLVGPYNAAYGWDGAIFEVTEYLWLAWQNWCGENGVTPRSKEWMVRMIIESPQGKYVRPGQKSPRLDGKQYRAVHGIQLRREARAVYAVPPEQFRARGAYNDSL